MTILQEELNKVVNIMIQARDIALQVFLSGHLDKVGTHKLAFYMDNGVYFLIPNDAPCVPFEEAMELYPSLDIRPIYQVCPCQ